MGSGAARSIRRYTPAVVGVVSALAAFAFACTSVDGFSQGDADGGGDGASSSSSGGDGSADGASDGGGTCNADLQTSEEHCGRCNHSCLGGGCVSGKCQPITIGVSQESPSELVIDGDLVFWRSAGSGKVLRATKSGGTLPAVVACGSTPGLAHGDGYVYAHCSCDLEATPDDGGAMVKAPQHCGARLITLDESAVYIVAQGPQVYRKTPRGAKLGGAGELPLGSYGAGTIYAIAHQGDHVFHTFAPSDTSAGRVAYVSTDAGPRTPLAPNEPMPRGLAVDDAGVAWVVLGAVDDAGAALPDAGAIRAQKLVGESPHVIAQLTPQPYAIALDETYVYFASTGTLAAGYHDAAIYRARRDGSGTTVEVIAVDQTRVEGIAVDDEAIYWTSRSRTDDAGALLAGTGSVKKIAKP